MTALLAGSGSTEDAGSGRFRLTMPHTISKIRMASRIRMPDSSAFRLSRCLCSGSSGSLRTGVSGFMVRVSSSVYSLEESA